MKDRILKNWNFMRVVRLLLAIYASYQAIELQQYLLFLIAALFFYQSIWNVSPCGIAGTCEIKPKLKED